MHIVAYFKKLWKKKIKKAWFRSYLINISGWSNKFVSDNQFRETIILLNKKNINPSANAKSDKFFCKSILQNVLLLYNSKKGLSQATESTRHSNHHLIVGNYLDGFYLVKCFTKEAVFYKQLVGSNGRSNLPNLFVNSNTLLIREVLLIQNKTSF